MTAGKMIDISEATKLIRDMLPIIDPEEDYLTIVAAEQTIASSEAKRKKEMEEAMGNYKALLRELEKARAQAQRPASAPTEEAHLATLHDLYHTGMRTAKEIRDIEGNIVTAEGELAHLKEETRRLEGYDPAMEHVKELDGGMLRLALYKRLGFEPMVDKDGTVRKMLVRAQSGDVHIVDLTTGKSTYEYTQLLWNLVNS